MVLEIRKFVEYSEEIHVEGFKKANKPLHIFAVAAVITNIQYQYFYSCARYLGDPALWLRPAK